MESWPAGQEWGVVACSRASSLPTCLCSLGWWLELRGRDTALAALSAGALQVTFALLF